jgi:hypothetical protein
MFSGLDQSPYYSYIFLGCLWNSSLANIMNQHRISRRGSASMLFIAPIVYKQEYKLLIFLLSVEWSQILVHVFALNVTFTSKKEPLVPVHNGL